MSDQIRDYRVIVGKNIQLAVENRDMTQAGLADQLGIASSQLNGYIKGKSMPNPGLFQQIALCFDMTVQQLLCGEEFTSEEVESESDKLISDNEFESFDLSNELKAECRSMINYAKTLQESTSNKKVISLANLIKNKATFVGENL